MNIAARGGNNRQVLILIDGVPINDPSLPNSEFDLRLLNLNDIESIEVVKGPSSVVYGSGAATAVIQINKKNSRYLIAFTNWISKVKGSRKRFKRS
jgi:vitamin B12 transporter